MDGVASGGWLRGNGRGGGGGKGAFRLDGKDL